MISNINLMTNIYIRKKENDFLLKIDLNNYGNRKIIYNRKKYFN